MSGVKIHTKEDAFRLFDEAVTALINSNFIITQKPITDLLRCLVFSEQLRTFIADCKKGVDYEAELVAAVQQTETGYAFVLPKGNKRVIALVTGLLRDFDMGTRSMTAFLHDFYPVNDNHERYKRFCDSVLLPYKRAFRQSFLYDIDDPQRGSEEERVAVGDAVLEGAEPLFASLRTVFLGDNKLSQKTRDELIYLTDGLYYALEKGDGRLIKTVWTGLKLAIAENHKKAERKFSDISEFLALYSLI